ncbi:Na-translocating system protein MpsC family protein [Virgibacillus xinjiangensis]|uniref:Na-translocating system protein MpsC family protein n=1 Tax=Virgibacillus xinjiangensis TaxID=393090 RepID=A0ABV7CWE3_9BACI
MTNRTVESVIASSVGKLLRDHFGKGPEAVFVTVAKPFITIYLRNFMAPMEKVLLDKDNDIKVQDTRDVLMEKLLPEINTILSSETGERIDHIYYDWALPNHSGVIFAEMDMETPVNQVDYDYPARATVHQEIDRITREAQKPPHNLKSFMLNTRTLFTRREDILVMIERELIENGFEEELRLAKRRLEKRLLNIDLLETELGQKIEDVFVDWNFDNDTGYMIFILK